MPRGVVLSLLLVVVLLTGCNHLGNAVNGQVGGGIDRADDLGLADQPITSEIWQIPPEKAGVPPGQAPAMASSLTAANKDPRQFRNDYAEVWMARSDYLCRQYKDRIISISRGERLGTDLLSGLLSGLATIFSKIGTVHPLTGAATIVTGAGAAISAESFAKQTGDVIASAIQTSRENQANVIEENLKKPVTDYSVYRVRRDIVEYHSMCSLETALSQIRTSLKQTSPDAGTTPPAKQGDQKTGGAGIVGGAVSVLEKAKNEVDKTVQTAPSPIPTGERPDNLVGGELALRLRISDVITIQNALGVKPAAGDIGKLGSPTRDAIAEFQYGMSQVPNGWPSPKTPGVLTRRTADLLTTLVPMPEIFSTPFERAFLGNPGGHARLDPDRVDEILSWLRPTQDERNQNRDKVQLMRKKIGEFRTDKKQFLDQETYEKLKASIPSDL